MHCQLSEGEVRLMRKAHFKTENKATEEMLELQRKVPNKYFLVRHKNDTETTAKFDDLEKQFERKEETTIWI
jgi:radical SAM superfamily enzyme